MFFIVIACLGILLPLGTGIVALGVFGRPSRRRGHPALLIHAVSETAIAGFSWVRTDRFAALCSYLHEHGYKTRTVDEECGRAETDDTGHRACVLTFDDGFADFFDTALPILDTYGIRATVFVISGFIGGRSTWDVYGPRPHLDAEQIRRIAQAGHEVGSHTATHPDLLLLASDDARREFIDSKKTLEDIIAGPVRSISFPFGRWNRRLWELARECGYRNAVVYGNHVPAGGRFVRVTGVYSFDTATDIIDKVSPSRRFSNSAARGRIMPHFAKGSPLYRFRPEYRSFGRDTAARRLSTPPSENQNLVS